MILLSKSNIGSFGMIWTKEGDSIPFIGKFFVSKSRRGGIQDSPHFSQGLSDENGEGVDIKIG